MSSGRLRLAVAVATVAGAVGCAGIPTGGAVHVGRAVPLVGGGDQVDVRILPKGPVAGMAPADIVRGFLRSMVDSDGDYEVARTYLTARASSGWRPTTVTTYDDSSARLVSSSRSARSEVLDLVAPSLGDIDGRGDFTARPGRLDQPFTVVKQGSAWRIDRVPNDVVLSTSDTQRAYHLLNVYYPNRLATALVAEQVLLRPEPPGLTTALVRTLVDGPGPWIAPAVRSAFPVGTDLLGNVPIDPNGTAEVNLSGTVRQASPQQLRALFAQVVWTLRQVPTITSVRVMADGSPLATPSGGDVQPITSLQAWDPAAPPSTTAAVYEAGGFVRSTTGSLRGLPDAGRLLFPVVSHDARTIAGVRAAGRRVALVTAHVGSAPRVRLTALTMTPPTFDPSGDVYTVVTDAGGRRVVEIAPDGSVHPVTAAPLLTRHPVQEIRLSRDGARIAAVVGTFGSARVYVGRVLADREGTRFDTFRSVLPSATDVRGVAWTWTDGVAQVVVTADAGSGQRVVLAVDPDGYLSATPNTIDTTGVIGQPVDVSALGPSLAVVADGVVWQRSAVRWRRIGPGFAPAFAD